MLICDFCLPYQSKNSQLHLKINICKKTIVRNVYLKPLVYTLSTDGDQLEEAEARLLGEILRASNIEFFNSGVNTQQLLDGVCSLTYEEMQFALRDNPITQYLSMNLKQRLQTSK